MEGRVIRYRGAVRVCGDAGDTICHRAYTHPPPRKVKSRAVDWVNDRAVAKEAANIGTNASSVREALSLIAKTYAAERERRVQPLLEKLERWLKKKGLHLPSEALGM